MKVTGWKTTAAGLLSGFIATVGPVTAYLATTPSQTSAKVCAGLTLAGVIARVWVGIISNDAPPNTVSSVTVTATKVTPTDTPKEQ
jgi:hypothetical protein